MGKELLDNRTMFSSQIAYDSFVGYAVSQLKKMQSQSYQGYMGEKRKELVKKYGYDVKNASHLIRLLRMGKEFLETGELQVYRTTDRDELLGIKQGKYTLTQIEQMYNQLFAEIDVAKFKCQLPKEPDFAKVSALAERLIEMKLSEKEES
jgi:type III secretory pathway component EscV